MMIRTASPSGSPPSPGVVFPRSLLHPLKAVTVIIMFPENRFQIVGCDPQITFVAPDRLSKSHRFLLVFAGLVRAVESLLTNGWSFVYVLTGSHGAVS